ncbi:MAG: ArsR family transcriptional regulator, partial [Bacteroidetes bacterium]
PGGLTSAISPAEFGTKSHSRNPLIFGLFVRIHMVEQVGSGIGRINDLLKKANLPKPEFKTKGMFTVVFNRAMEETTRKTTQKTTQKILNLISQNPKISRKEMANNIIGITEDGVKYNLNKLKNNGIIERIGPAKGGHWKILKKL